MKWQERLGMGLQVVGVSLAVAAAALVSPVLGLTCLGLVLFAWGFVVADDWGRGR